MNKMKKIEKAIKHFYWEMRNNTHWTNEDGTESTAYEIGNECIMIMVYNKEGNPPVRHVYTNDRRKIAAAIMKEMISIWPWCGIEALTCYRWSKAWKNRSGKTR